MRDLTVQPSQRYVRLAGLLYLVNFVVAGVAPVHILPRLVVPGDADATAANIMESPWMLHLAVAGDLVTMLTEVALCALFYLILRPVDRNLAVLMVCFRLAYTAMVINNVRELYAPLRMLTGDPDLAAFPADQRADLAMLSLDAYHDGFIIALLFFGAQILLVGLLLYKSRFVPRVLGGWLMVGSLGFFAYSFVNLTVPGGELPLTVVAPSALGEFVLLVLLLLNRLNRQPRQTSAQPPV